MPRPKRQPNAKRDPKSTTKSVRYHNRVAKKYDDIYDDPFWRFHDDVTWQHVKPHLPVDLSARCLDLGCGTGKWGLKLQKSGFATTFVDHSPGRVDEVRGKLDELGGRAVGCDAIVADIVEMPDVPSETYALTLAMGDPISICSDPKKAAAEMFRCAVPGGIVIATADNQLSAAAAYVHRGDFGGLESLLKSSRTRWVTTDAAEQFELHTFTPSSLRRTFEGAGFDVLGVVGKTILPVRDIREQLADASVLRRLVKLEMSLAKDEGNAAAAGHLQIVARRPA